MTKKTTPKIIGIAGTNGSGKDTVGKLLEARHNYLFVSVTDLLRAELERRGLPPAREQMRQLSAEWRRESGLGVLVDKARELFEQTNGYNGLVMASLRNPGEADAVHAQGGVMVWLDADARQRYERIQANAHTRGGIRAVDDQKSFEQFLAEEAVEMDRPIGGDAATLSMTEVRAKCDIRLLNDSDSIEELSRQLDEALGFAS